MNAVLYICHGSRLKQAQEQAIAFIQTCMSERLAPIQEYCFLELAEPSIEAAFKVCVEKGAKKIIVVPVLLLAAAHAKEDIPKELARLKQNYPEIKLIIEEPIGVHPSIPEILKERIEETNKGLPTDSMVLLVGRGSSDPDVRNDLGKIAEMLKATLNNKKVDTSFLVAASPSFEEALQMAKQSRYKKVFVIPYLLFTGILMKKIEKIIKEHKEKSLQEIILCRYLGYHPLLKNILKERVIRSLNEDNDMYFQ
ncbi:sirohydrochlorin chelatase [Neobacillus sp. LXY-4]|uniref:sirohydrochlorin chelatase n=1 Tax=Neobacillus sp. LXY-4 TaxID=3379826 RepID=UPI003EDED985